jgi:hypothetical protein
LIAATSCAFASPLKDRARASEITWPPYTSRRPSGRASVLKCTLAVFCHSRVAIMCSDSLSVTPSTWSMVSPTV